MLTCRGFLFCIVYIGRKESLGCVMKIKNILLICVFLVLIVGGAIFGWYGYSTDHTDCTKSQIIADLKIRLNKDKTIYKENHSLDKVLGQHDVLKVIYRNKKFYGTHTAERSIALTNFLNKHVKLKSDKNFVFYMFVLDVAKVPELDFSIKHTPILMTDMDRGTYIKNTQFLVPDYFLIRKGFGVVSQKVRKKGDSIPFLQRKDIVFWRGAQTGGGLYNYDNKEKFPRYNLVMFSFNNPSYLDARFVSHKLWVEDSESGSKYIKHMNSLFGDKPEKYTTSAKDHVPYKYLISLDGTVSAWDRPIKIMNGKSVLLYNSKFIQFFTPYMQEGKHYVGVKEDLSDLKDKVDWLRSNPQEAERIANNGRVFAEQLNPKLFACYYQNVLEHIQKNFVSS